MGAAVLPANAVLPTTDDRYRTLFTAIDAGCGVLELLDNDHGQPVYWRILESIRPLNA